MMKGKTVEEIRDTFGIVNDFTPEEEVIISFCLWPFDWVLIRRARVTGSYSQGERKPRVTVMGVHMYLQVISRRGRRINDLN